MRNRGRQTGPRRAAGPSGRGQGAWPPGEPPASLLVEVQRIALLFPEEIDFLFRRAGAMVGREGAIVDLGTFKGGSAICLALGVRAGGGSERVTTVDSFEANPDFPGEGWGVGGEVHREFLRNVARFGVGDWITLLIREAGEAALAWHEPVKLLFYDTSVMYEKVAEDIRRWAPFVVAGGLMLFHDYSGYPVYGSSLRPAVDDFVARSPEFVLVARFGETAVVQRRR